MSTSASLYGVAVGTASTAILGLSPIVTIRAPAPTDIRGPGGPLKIGQVWVDTVANASYILTSFSSLAGQTTANWSLQGATAGVLDTLSGDSGGTITPTAGNIALLGTSGQIVTTGTPSTITFSIDDPFNIPGDVVIPGTLTVTGLTTLGALTQVGTLSLNATGAATTTIGSATAGAISVDTTSGITLNADAASSFTTTDAGADLSLVSTLGSVNITSGEDAADAILLTSSAGGIELLATGEAAQDIVLTNTGGSVKITGTEAVVDAIQLNATTALGGIDVNAGTGGMTVDSGGLLSLDAAGIVNLTTTGAFDITVNSTAGSVIVTGAEAAVDAIQLNATTALGGIDINAGTGGITIDSTGAFSIDGAAASNVTTTGAGIDLTLSSVLGSVLVESTENAALAIRLHANGGTSETIQLHADQGTGVGSINLLSDVGGLTFTSGLASADAINLEASAGGIDVDAALQINITSSQNAVDAIRILSSAGGMDIDAVGAATEDINVTNTGGSIVLVATEAAGDAVVIQASNAAGGIDLIAGTGDVEVTGNLTFTTAGNKIKSTSVATTTTGGANSFGSVTLVAGTATVATTAITTNSLVFLTRQTIGATGAAALGMISRGAISNGVSFVIDSLLTADATALATTDVSNVAWFIVN